MEKTYNPQDIEQPLYEHWEKQGYFKPNGDESQESFCIMIPPPNVTGSLHMGHAFQQTIMDTMIRYQRMQGKNTLWQVGTDHAGIATQMVVERKIAAEEGKTRHDYGREAFIDKIWEWKAESGGTITRQMRRLGNSVDWERERFTMDEGLSNAVKEVFVRLYKEDLIYRGKRLVNWDPKLRTAISDLEVENRESKGSMWHIRYPLADGAKTADGKDYLVVATTRPETLLGDTGVAVNPEDPRYKDLIGKYVILPLVNRRIPIVGDEHADMEKGTGCVKITPAHDFNDYEVGKRHALPMINILTFDGDIRESAQVFDTKGNESDVYSSEIPAEFQKLERFAARKAVVAAVDALGLLEEIKPHDLTVPYGDRGGVVIEPMLTDQWYVRADVLAKPAVEAVENGDIQFVPKQYENMYFSWMRDIQDWCISRQLWWGHRIPAWYDEAGNVYVGRNEEEVRKENNLGADVALRQDEDVLDTWFSSALWTFSTLGWPENTDALRQFHPTSVMVSGFDIIFFWIARMIMMTMHFIKDENGKPQVPFHTVYMTGLIRDDEGQKMSKSKGNFFMVRDAAKEFGYETIRMFMLSAHYRTPLNYSAESLEMNKASLARLYEARNNMEFRISKAEGDAMTVEESAKMEALAAYKQKFIDAMDDDLNTADALSAIFELTREINAYMGAHQDATKAFLTAAHALFMELTGVLNIVQKHEDAAADPDAEKIEALIAQRAAAKKEKNFAEADRIRDELAAMGVTIKDTRQGTQWSRA